MIPFDLELAKKGKPVITRDGTAATFVTMLQRNIPAPLLMDVGGVQENYYINGRFESVHDHKLDLFMDDDVILEYEEDEDEFDWEEDDDE